MQRKEFTLEQATAYKSLIGNAYDKGYNVSRGKNIRVKLRVTPKNTGSLQAWSNIGQYSDYDVTLLKPVSFTLGIPTDIEVILGNRASESILASSNNVQLFRFVSDDVTDDVRLFLNESEISDYSTDIKDLLDDKYVMLSNSYGSVNVFYLQKGDRKYKVGDYLTLDYIIRNNISYSSIALESFYLPSFNVEDMFLISEREAIETKDDIRINAALHAETEGIIRARADFSKVLREYEPTIASISDEDIQPGRIGIYILKDDMQPLTEEDRQKYNKTVKARTVSGVANLIYEDAAKYKTPLNVKITTSENIGTSSNLLNNIDSALLKYQYELGSLINFDDIERYIEQQEGVKVARISVPTSAWSKKTYRVSDTCISSNFDDRCFYVSGFNFKTGESTPEWDTPDENGYIEDNNILWKQYNGNADGIMVWKQNTSVRIGRLVVDVLDTQKRVFECVGYVTKTGDEIPNWVDFTDYIIDNNIVWEEISPTENYKEYKNNSIYRIGETIRVDLGGEEEPSYKFFRVVDYAMPTGESEPNWDAEKTPDGYIEDGDILLWSETTYPIRFLQLDNNAYAEFNSKVSA